MALVGYARISILEPSYKPQEERLKQAGCTKIFIEVGTGTTKPERSELRRCLNYLREEDTLVITGMDRLGRSLHDLYHQVHDFEQRKIGLVVLDQPINTHTVHEQTFIQMLAMLTEFETLIRKERQLEGIAKAKAGGLYKGRKATAQARKAEIEALMRRGMNKTAIAKQLGICVASVYNVLKTPSITPFSSSD